jgi:hypothetical protein
LAPLTVAPVTGSAEIIGLTCVGGRVELALKGAGAMGTAATLRLVEIAGAPPMTELSCPLEVPGRSDPAVAVPRGAELIPTGFTGPAWAIVPLEVSLLLGAWDTVTTLGVAPPDVIEPVDEDPTALRP